ncbi:MAG: aldo/keto reductase [Muribaculaceae bacterium]|nr:aldo/keto reductase [Muribaculaceae bacterium]
MAQITFTEPYKAAKERYDGTMKYNRCGKSSLKLPALTLGFWWNFGGIDPYCNSLAKMTYAFDHGIFSFDLANNYGPPFGSAEETFGKIYSENFRAYRHEMIVTTKAGYNMWAGPNGQGSSRKMLISSIDESLGRMKLDYVDIFYSHRYDGETPIEETMQALVDIVKQGKALYVGLSNYPIELLQTAIDYLSAANTPCLIYQGKYNMLVRDMEKGHIDTLINNNVGFTAFSPIAQGVLSNKYLNGIPSDSRIATGKYITTANIPQELIERLKKLDIIAKSRNQNIAQLATSWLLAKRGMTSVIIGPRTIEQLADSIKAVDNTSFSNDQLSKIDNILAL